MLLLSNFFSPLYFLRVCVFLCLNVQLLCFFLFFFVYIFLWVLSVSFPLFCFCFIFLCVCVCVCVRLNCVRSHSFSSSHCLLSVSFSFCFVSFLVFGKIYISIFFLPTNVSFSNSFGNFLQVICVYFIYKFLLSVQFTFCSVPFYLFCLPFVPFLQSAQ